MKNESGRAEHENQRTWLKQTKATGIHIPIPYPETHSVSPVCICILISDEIPVLHGFYPG